MNKKTSLVLASLLATASLGYAGAGHKHQEGKAAAADVNTVTMTGEVIDMSCYMEHDGKGKEHQKCAKMCLLDKRVPAGLLGDDGSVVLLVADHKNEKAFAPILGWAAEKVTVTGKRVSKGGLSALLVTAAEKAK